LQKNGKGIIYLGSNYAVGILGKPDLYDIKELENSFKEQSKKEVKC
jgi:hypothetical protein